MGGDDDEVYSSSTYRIDAIRVLHKVMAASRDTSNNNELFDSAETHIMNWSFGLPDVKKRPIDREGVVDEVLFEAHMILSA
jgi:hypothetical protein